jgi:hypothetical protein
MRDLQQFSTSSNGDSWFLGKREGDGELAVLHRANLPSGGHETETWETTRAMTARKVTLPHPNRI